VLRIASNNRQSGTVEVSRMGKLQGLLFALATVALVALATFYFARPSTTRCGSRWW
jgi:hypothetical protein